ncbi:MAG: TetR/AcrR family transcriptional regulator [Gammaproteobacteria bacterium]|nr:TetR/AcrR family transcriptional regulator [Gammaproteobacteria bacterium]NNJ97943.1 TetR/AcrR family transcriptional regulator [Gammaproteobacteria bacterium]
MNQKKQKRISKSEWLACALTALERAGIDSVRVDQLSRQLGVARSGFYWHFKDRRDLLNHMLEYWAHEYTEVVTSNKALAEGPAVQRLENIMRTVRDFELNRFEAAVFIWSQTDPAARETFNRVYKIRLNFIREIFNELGFKGDEADMRAQLFMGYLAWEYTDFSPQSKAKQDRLLKLRLRLLTKK